MDQVITNEGASALITLTLPAAGVGKTKSFYVQNANGIKVVAGTGDTIRIEGNVSAAAGYIQSTTIGSFVTLVSINSTEWVATHKLGTWSVT